MASRNVQFYGSMNKALGGDPIQRDYAQDPRRLMAQQLMQQGSSTAPVQSPLEGLTRALSGVAGGYFGGQAQRDMQEREQALSSDISTAMEAATPRVVPATPATYSQSGIGDFEPSTPETTTKGGFAGIVDALRPMDNPDLSNFRQQALMGEMQQRQAAEQAALARVQGREDLEYELKLKQKYPNAASGRAASSIQISDEYDKRVQRDGKDRADAWYKKFVNQVYLNTGSGFVSRADAVSGATTPEIPINLKPGQETQYKKDVKIAENEAKAEGDKIALGVKNAKAMAAFEVGMGGVETAFANLSTDPITGRFPALTAKAQIAEGSVSAMAPILKSLFRESGEGVFTDKDQDLLLNMAPKRTDHPEVATHKIKMIRQIVGAKLGQSTGQGGGSPVPVVNQNQSPIVKLLPGQEQSQFDALPPGTRFEGPDGNVRTKP